MMDVADVMIGAPSDKSTSGDIKDKSRIASITSLWPTELGRADDNNSETEQRRASDSSLALSALRPL